MTTKPNAKTTALPPRYAQVHKMLSAASGATISEIAAACGWLNHSTRAMISTGRSRFGWRVEKFRDDERGLVYAMVVSTTTAKTPRAKAALKPKARAAKKQPAVKPRKAVMPAADPAQKTV